MGLLTVLFRHGKSDHDDLASGKMYVAYDRGLGLFLVDRTLGSIPRSISSRTSSLATHADCSVYNVGNQNATFTNATRAFTESGNGVGSFTFGAPHGHPLHAYRES